MPKEICEACGLPDQWSDNAGPYRLRFECARCGTFEWEASFTPPMFKTPGLQVKLSAFIREQNKAGIPPLLRPELIQEIERRALPRLRDRALSALAAMVQEVGCELSTTFSTSDKLRIHAVSYSADDKELSVLLQILEGYGFIKADSVIPTKVRLATAGLIQADELSQPRAAYLQGFVAMSFDPSMNDAYTLGFDPAITAAGYHPFRIDGKEHINGISDEILAEIRRSRFLVADYTLKNNGVYFEAGVAIGLGIQVIGTCHADHFDDLHFDIKHINTLKWKTPEQLAHDLAKRISGVIGDGPLRLT